MTTKQYSLHFTSVVFLALWLPANIVSGQSNITIGYIDRNLVEVDPVTGDITTIAQCNVPDDIRILNLVQGNHPCKLYGIQEGGTEPALVSIDFEGNYDYIARLTMPGETVFSCEALTYNPDDEIYYVSLSLNGNPAVQDFYTETLATVDIKTGVCTFVSQLQQGSTYQTDMDWLHITDNILYIIDNRPSTVTGFYSIPLSGIANPFNPIEAFSVSPYVTARDLTDYNGNLIYATSDRELIIWDISTNTTLLFGTTHIASEYNGVFIDGLEFTQDYIVPCIIECTDSNSTPTPCDDGDPCTMNDIEVILDIDCSICIPCQGEPVDCTVGEFISMPCNDNDPCTSDDEELFLLCDNTVCLPCQGDTATCENGEVTVLDCDDNNPCTINDKVTTLDCDGAICIPCQGELIMCDSEEISFLDCDDNNPCTINDTEVILDCDGSICQPCLGESINCIEDGTFFVECDDNNPCTSNDRVELSNCDGSVCVPCIGAYTDKQIFMPNIIYSQADNGNNLFQVKASEEIEIIFLYIFDRWGNKIFSAENTTNLSTDAIWNGNFDNQTVIPGVYTLILQHECQAQEQMITHDILILH